MGSRNDSGDPAALKYKIYKEKLSKLECPFTWDMDDVCKKINTDYNPHDEEESIPLLKLLRTIMTVYVDVKDDEDRSDIVDIIDNLKKCDDNYKALKSRKDPEISSRVVYAVLQATKCFVYLKLKMLKELDLLLKNLENISKLNNQEKSTLLGCKSICWSKYHRVGSCEAEQFVRQAIKLNGKCGLWHYILGKNIRRQRRDLSISGKPNEEEARSFLKAYETSKNPIYGIFVAQMYRERKQFGKAEKLYEEIFANVNSLSNNVLLRLALGFMNQKKLDKAGVCLDKAEESCSEHSMYLHYRGIYYLKKKQFPEAVPYFKKAMEDLNLPAEKQYLECLIKTRKSVDVTAYLLHMLDKYQSFPEKQLQSIVLDVAFSYWKRERDLKKAIEYFLKAIEIDPKARCITNFFNNDVNPIKERNIYVFLENFILPDIDKDRNRFDQTTIENVQAIKEFCKVHKETQMDNLGRAMNRIQIQK